MADHDGQGGKRDPAEVEEGVERHARDDPGQGQREHEEEAHRLAPEEPHPVDGEGRAGAQQQSERGGDEACLQGEGERRAHLRVVPGLAEPSQRQRADRPALDVGAVEGIEEDQENRHEQEQQDQHHPDLLRQPRRSPHQSASKAPSRLAASR